MPKGKIVLKPISPKELYRYCGMIIAREAGLVRLLSKPTFKTGINYYFLSDPDIVLESTLREGFFEVVGLFEDGKHLPVRQSEIPKAVAFIAKKDSFRWDIFDSTNLTQTIQLFIDESSISNGRTVVLDARRAFKLPTDAHTSQFIRLPIRK